MQAHSSITMVLPTPTRQYTFLASMLTLTVTVFGVCERGIEREKERKIEIERISKGGRENSVCVRVCVCVCVYVWLRPVRDKNPNTIVEQNSIGDPIY
mmetsp:Transcript_13357/g.21193  ORF Transcript_13357/g.21193 Transcript_13357/m.21193 type:complete len:98 (+) Transcript_13357:438-731(+)